MYLFTFMYLFIHVRLSSIFHTFRRARGGCIAERRYFNSSLVFGEVPVPPFLFKGFPRLVERQKSLIPAQRNMCLCVCISFPLCQCTSVVHKFISKILYIVLFLQNTINKLCTRFYLEEILVMFVKQNKKYEFFLLLWI